MQGLILGTAQWGSDYGRTNHSGRVSNHNLLRLIETASKMGITAVDTAANYGDSEERIAEFAPSFDVQTKLQVSGLNDDELEVSLEKSLRRVHRQSVRSILIHDWSTASLISRHRGIDFLQRAKTRGDIGKVGASIYSVEDLESVTDLWPEIDVVQLPISVLDQRFENSDAIDSLRRRGTIIQARSIFLQGVLLSRDASAQFGYCDPLTRWFSSFPGSVESRLSSALAFVLTRGWVDELVVGVTTASELDQISRAIALEPLNHDWGQYACTDPAIIDPRVWQDPARVNQ